MNLPGSQSAAPRRGTTIIGALALGAALVATAAAPAGAAFPGANGLIVFESNRDGKAEIYSMASDGTYQTRLTRSDGGASGDPSLSPDGQKIVFRSNRDGGDAEIYVMDADGTNQTRITNHPAPDYRPSFSPDGRKIVFVSERDGQPSIYVMNADGTDQARLAANPLADRPVFSPDGTKIAFEGADRLFGAAGQIFVMDADGRNPFNLTRTRDATSEHPSFSPDGGTMLFTSLRGAGSQRNQIFQMNALTGADPARITRDATLTEYQPAVSPDGSKIVFTRNAAEIFVMDRDGTGARRLTTPPPGRGDVNPDWGPRPRATVSADVLHGSPGRNVICGGGGSDVIVGFDGNDTLHGDACGNRARLHAHMAAGRHDRLHGGRGNDRLHGGPGRDVLRGGPGADRVQVRDGRRDRIFCGSGRDLVRADREDRLSGCERIRRR